MNPSDDYKLTDLDYLIGDHHLQMIKASPALPGRSRTKGHLPVCQGPGTAKDSGAL